jgi:hypothetical protein
MRSILLVAIVATPTLAFGQTAAQLQQQITTLQNKIATDAASIASVRMKNLITSDAAQLGPIAQAVGSLQSAGGGGGTGSGSGSGSGTSGTTGFTPPGTVTNVQPTMSISAINAALAKAGSGNTVQFSAGTYPAGVITVPSGVYAYSPNPCAAALSGSVVLSSNATLDGFQLNNALADLRNSKGATVGRSCFTGGAPADPSNPSAYPGNIVVWVDNAQSFLVVNSSFKNFPGGGVYGWTNSGRVAGNQFLSGREAINLEFTTVEIDHNYASGLTRMFVEIGANPDGDTSSGVSVHDNYEENLNPIPDPGAQPLDDAVAYSIVPANGTNTSIMDNFVSSNPGTCAIAVELNGNGTASGNYGVNCGGGVATYGNAAQTATNNNMVGTSWGIVANVNNNPNLKQSGNVANANQPIPAKPVGVTWH